MYITLPKNSYGRIERRSLRWNVVSVVTKGSPPEMEWMMLRTMEVGDKLETTLDTWRVYACSCLHGRFFFTGCIMQYQADIEIGVDLRRYLAYRYFHWKSALVVHGFEFLGRIVEDFGFGAKGPQNTGPQTSLNRWVAHCFAVSMVLQVCISRLRDQTMVYGSISFDLCSNLLQRIIDPSITLPLPGPLEL